METPVSHGTMGAVGCVFRKGMEWLMRRAWTKEEDMAGAMGEGDGEGREVRPRKALGNRIG